MGVREWGGSGLAHLTGLPDGAPDFSRAGVLDRAQRVAAVTGDRLGIPVAAAIDAGGLLAGRAGLLGLNRGGQVSAGAATRLLAALDGWCAITLSRPDDVAAVPALVQADHPQAVGQQAVDKVGADKSGGTGDHRGGPGDWGCD